MSGNLDLEIDELEDEELADEMLDNDDFSQCCFCEHTYLSYCCQECPARTELMPENPQECRCSQVLKEEKR